MVDEFGVPVLTGGGFYTSYKLSTGEILQTGEVPSGDWEGQVSDPVTDGVLNKAIDLTPSAWPLTGGEFPGLIFIKVNTVTLGFEFRGVDDEVLTESYRSQYAELFQVKFQQALAMFTSSASGERLIYKTPREGVDGWPVMHTMGYSRDRLMMGAAWAALDPSALVEVLAEVPAGGADYVQLTSPQMGILMRDMYAWHYYIYWYYIGIADQVASAMTVTDLQMISWEPLEDPPIPPLYVDG